MEQVSRSCLRNDQGRSKMKIWRIILTMLLMSFVCCGQAQADIASGSAGEEILWSLSETGVLTVSGQGEIGNYSMEYSENIKDYITTAPWGKYMEQISSVVIQPGIISVGEKAFSKLIYLKQVTLPDTLVRVENYACQGSFQIEEILIPDSVTYIGDHAFANLSHLKSFHFPAQLVSLGISAFYNCRMLESVVLPDGFLTTTRKTSFFRQSATNCASKDRKSLRILFRVLSALVGRNMHSILSENIWSHLNGMEKIE